ncbi:hypothetical protein B7486_61070 [cyanobacterium TDX16]|nr:hypothetical protein B7486_61070 [cyanobacterium TDX16]
MRRTRRIHQVSSDDDRWGHTMDTPDVDTATLWTIFGFIGTNWGNAAECDMDEAQFTKAVGWQVQVDPTQGDAYAQAVTSYQALLAAHGGDEQAALTQLYGQNQTGSGTPIAGVLLGFMRWQVAFGGFRTFGYTNYTGWMGGGSFLSEPPPYRALPPSPTRTTRIDGAKR